MATDILVRLEIPFTLYSPLLVFHRWLPLNDDEALILDQNDIRVRLWFDLNCSMLKEADFVDIEKHANVVVMRVHVDVEMREIPDELAEFIYEERERYASGPKADPDDRYKRLSKLYLDMGQRVLQSAIGAYNRLVTYARITKGQYWLEERTVDFDRMASDFAEFRAKVKIGSREWIRWHPTSEVIVHVRAVNAEDLARYISKADWPQAKEFLKGRSRPDLVLELLANSEALADVGYRRSAIIEAVAALEVATSRFSESPKLEAVMSAEFLNRIDARSLKSQVEHMGFSATIRFLLPLLFREEVLSSELIAQCQRAIEIRGNVVHQGQRDVDADDLLPLLKAIRETCVILARFTNDQPIMQPMTKR